MNAGLQQRLVQMFEEDATVRAKLAATGELFQGYAPRMAQIHHRNALKLDAIIDEYGWPGESLVGPEGVDAAWHVLLHAIGDPWLQRKCLPMLRQAVSQGEMKPAHVAYLQDRICFFEGRPQRYGTQFDWDEQGKMSPWMLEDPDHVDEHRHAAGLGPLADAISQKRGQQEESAPPDLQKRREEMEAWARSVGWRS